MAKSINQVQVRNNLPVSREPVWQPLGRGRSVGFRKMSKDTGGAWLGRWRDEAAGKYEYKTLGDLAPLPAKDRYAEAVRQLEEWFQHLEQGGQAGDDAIAAVCAAYANKLRRENSEDAARDAEARFRRLVNDDPLGEIDLAKLKPSHVLAWRDRVLKEDKRNTCNRNLAALRAALNFAYDSRKVSSDFAWSKALRPLKVDPGEGRRTLYLDRSQRQRLVESASAEFRPLVIAWTLLPVRPGELKKCKVEHLDTRHRELTIPKGKTPARVIPLTEAALAHFRACAKDKLPGAWLISRMDGRAWKKEMWRDAMVAAVEAAELPAGTIPYTLRHSTITDMVTGGVDIFTVAKLAGTSVTMIDKFYGKLRQEHARQALEILSL